jgi:hypothetical protein
VSRDAGQARSAIAWGSGVSMIPVAGVVHLVLSYRDHEKREGRMPRRRADSSELEHVLQVKGGVLAGWAGVVAG